MREWDGERGWWFENWELGAELQPDESRMTFRTRCSLGKIARQPGRVGFQPGRVGFQPGRVGFQLGKTARHPGRTAKPGRVELQLGRQMKQCGRNSQEYCCLLLSNEPIHMDCSMNAMDPN